ncbi:hypothetical protein NJ7G_3975 [Natrinema sp. J7-2]|nr:hypothetical protein NJ7G_3975 [Natrinema sp. J7-2]
MDLSGVDKSYSAISNPRHRFGAIGTTPASFNSTETEPVQCDRRRPVLRADFMPSEGVHRHDEVSSLKAA